MTDSNIKLRKTIDTFIETYLPSKIAEKSEFGEVFTPISMMETLYERFPKHVWKTASLKWLDPSGGVGNFPLVLFVMLMNGLSNVFPNEKKRSKHIIENMIYIVEINSKNYNICKKIFNTISPESNVNIHQGDFLKFDPETIHWPKYYNCIIGNPPYNIGGTGLKGTKRTHIIFTEYSLNLLTHGGYLAFICPPSYRETNTPMNKLFKDANGHFIFIKIYGASETNKLFNIQGRVDSFIFQKDSKGHTIIDDEYGIITTNIQLNLDTHIPNFGITIFNKLYKKVEKIGHIKAFRNTEMSSIKAATFGCGGKNKIIHLIIEKGRRVFKTKKKHSLASKPKLLINGLGVPYVFNDTNGNYGLSQSPIVILNPSKNVVHLLNTQFFSFVAWGLRLTGNNNLPYLFNAVPDVSKEKNPYKTIDDIKRGFDLSKQEVTFIETFHKYNYTDKDIIEKCVKTQKLNKSYKKKQGKSRKVYSK